MKCPYCNEDLDEWEDRFYCANMLCPANGEDLPKFIWQDIISGKKAQRQLRTVKERCVKKIKAKEREIASCLNGISVRQSENERLAKQLKQAQDALDVAVERLELIAHETFQGEPSGINMGFHVRAAAALADINKIIKWEE